MRTNLFALLYLFGLVSATAWLFSGTPDRNQYELVKSHVRNILFVGRSRAGKSTLVEVLKNKDYKPRPFNGLRETVVMSVNSFTIFSKSSNANTHFNIIDTPDVFARLTGDDNKLNGFMLNLNLKCIEMNITEIHHVYFVISIQTGPNQDDLKAFKLFADLFPSTENKTSIILSFAQNIVSDEDYHRKLDKFRTVPELKQVYQQINESVHFLGAVNSDRVRQNVYAQRVRLFDHIMQQNESFNVKQLVKTRLSSSEYELIEADARNIIFVGRSRSGKSTLIEVLKDKNHVPRPFDVVRQTTAASLNSFTMYSKSSNSNIHFNIMDTPGVFERTTDLNDRRTNKVILDLILKCIDMEITKIHHVYFVISIQQGLNEQDIDAFELFTDLFVGMENKISIVLSFSQHVVSDEDYTHYLNQFRKLPELTQVYQRINESVHFLGAVKNSSTSNIETLRQNVYAQRAALFDHIMQQDDWFNVKQLKAYREGERLKKTVRDKLSSLCDQHPAECEEDLLQRLEEVIAHNYIGNSEFGEEKTEDQQCGEQEAANSYTHTKQNKILGALDSILLFINAFF